MKLNTFSGETCSIWERITSVLDMMPSSLFCSSTTGSFWIPERKMTLAASLMLMSGSATIRCSDITFRTGVDTGWKRRSRAAIYPTTSFPATTGNPSCPVFWIFSMTSRTVPCTSTVTTS